jgi:hypothetical protein
MKLRVRALGEGLFVGLLLVVLLPLSAGAAAPSITVIPDQVILKNQVCGPITFRVNDDGGPASLILVSSSSNKTLVPDNQVRIAAPKGTRDRERTVTVTPVTNGVGVTTITITAYDGPGNTFDRSFLVTVNDPNSPPTITSLPAQFIPQNSATAELALTVGDAQTPAGQLILRAAADDDALFPPGSISLGGEGANRSVRAVPASNASGASLITVTVSDGTLSASTDFLVTVLPPLILSMPRAGEVRWSGMSNVTYTVLASTNLSDWTRVGGATSPASALSFIDAGLDGAQRFYRVTLP